MGARTKGWIICRFDSTLDLKGKALTYENIKARVLAAGRFSIFEATHDMKRARLFTALNRDPDLTVTTIGYPWFSVARRSEE